MKAYFGSDGATQVVGVNGRIEPGSPASEIIINAFRDTASQDFSKVTSADFSGLTGGNSELGFANSALPLAPGPKGWLR